MLSAAQVDEIADQGYLKEVVWCVGRGIQSITGIGGKISVAPDPVKG